MATIAQTKTGTPTGRGMARGHVRGSRAGMAGSAGAPRRLRVEFVRDQKNAEGEYIQISPLSLLTPISAKPARCPGSSNGNSVQQRHATLPDEDL